MKIGDEQAIAQMVLRARRSLGLSQAELAERARVSDKTIQRMEGGAVVAGSSRRAILAALGIDAATLPRAGDPHRAPRRAEDERREAAGSWQRVEGARALLARLGEAESVDIEIDREGWRQARANRPWYKKDLVFATKDPVDLMLNIVDEVSQSTELSPARAAKRCDDLAEILRAMAAMSWACATRVDTAGELSLYIGSPTVVRDRLARC